MGISQDLILKTNKMKKLYFTLTITLVSVSIIVSCGGKNDSSVNSTNEATQNKTQTPEVPKATQNIDQQEVKKKKLDLIDPISFFKSQPKSTLEKSYYANVSMEEAKNYFKSLNLIKYSSNAFDPKTVRFRNSERNIFIMIFPEGLNRVYIVMSREEYCDEVDV
jgi:hypothetical protein